MSTLDYKALKILALECRKVGIKHFKNSEFEFTLTDEVPVSNYKRKKTQKLEFPISNLNADIEETNKLTDEQLLLYSVTDFQSEGSTNEN